MVYGVPLSGTGAPYAMDAATVEQQWAQVDVPTEAAAIFPADNTPTGNTVTSTTTATLYYLNASGQVVNVAMPGGHISTTEYDDQRNVIRSLTAANRARALGASDKPARARELDTQSVYGANGLEMIEEFGPQHEVVVAGQTVQARSHTVTQYDDDDLHLPVRISTGARVSGQSTDSDIRVSTNTYGPVGEKLRKPTATTVDPTGLNLSTRFGYDEATAQETSRTLPKGDPGNPSAHTTKTTLYTVGGSDPCGAKPEWAGLPCRIEPAAQPGADLPRVPITTVTYNRWLQPVATTETVPDTVHYRTTSRDYDAAGRLASESITASSGSALPPVTRVYSATTGRETALGTPDKTITRVYDSVGRLTSYTDATGTQSTNTYDRRDRPVTSNDGKGSQTRLYDTLRGQLVRLTDSQAGVITATYDPDGTRHTMTYPNGLTATSAFDEAGNETRRVYAKATSCGSSCTWLDSQAPVNAHDQRTRQTTVIQGDTLSTASYEYDAAGRLARTSDTPRVSGCTVRDYTYDANSNRVKLTSKTPASGGVCDPGAIGTETLSTYDQADRLSGAGYAYDAFGRTLTVPAASAGGSTLTSTYYANDTTASITQDGVTQSYALDASLRISTRSTSGAGSATQTNHYSNDADAPSWIAETTDGATYIRQIEGIGGDLAAVRDSAGTRLQLTNLHDDVVAEASTSTTATSPLWSGDNDEFGVPRAQPAHRNQWLGGKQRSTELAGGIVAMGARMYLPQAGRFLSTDPVAGGSANAYDYAMQDPVNGLDLDGRAARPRSSRMCKVLERNLSLVGAGGGIGYVFWSIYGGALANCNRNVKNLAVGVQIIGGYMGTKLDRIAPSLTQTTTCRGSGSTCSGSYAHSGRGFTSCGVLRGRVDFRFRLAWSYGGKRLTRSQLMRIPVTITSLCA